MQVELSIDILDHIFSFLVSHRETLVACSKDPVLSPIVERHLYYHLTLQIGNPRSDSNVAFEPGHLSKLISENPRIPYYVRILQIVVHYYPLHPESLDKFSDTLLMFPVLECIVLSDPTGHWYLLHDHLRAALEDRFNLPTVKEVHLLGDRNGVPIFLLNDCKNIKNLSLSTGYAHGELPASTLPQLHSLRLLDPIVFSSVLDWLKLHINELRSLKCVFHYWETLSELLRVCSGTLNRLDVNLENSLYSSDYEFRTRRIVTISFPKLSSVPPNLERFTIRTAVNMHRNDDQPPGYRSWLPAAARAINLFISSLRHLVIDINICLSTLSDLSEIDFSPLVVLGPASLSIPRMDLYVHSGDLPSATIHSALLPSLEAYEDIAKLIKEGVLVVHSGKTAPDLEQNWQIEDFD